MTDKPETAVLPMDPQPVYLIAGQSAPEQPGLSIVDALVWAYRRRWWLVVWFVVLAGIQAFQISVAGQVQSLFTVRSERGVLDPVMVALQAELASAGDAVRNLNSQIDFLKLGTNAKAEVSRNALVVLVSSAADAEPPAIVTALRQSAQRSAEKVEASYLQQANLALQVATMRAQSLRSDASSTVTERAAAELAVANAKVAVETPLDLQVSEIERIPLKGSLAKSVAIIVMIATVGSVLLVALGWGYGEVRRRAARA